MQTLLNKSPIILGNWISLFEDHLQNLGAPTKVRLP